MKSIPILLASHKIVNRMGIVKKILPKSDKEGNGSMPYVQIPKDLTKVKMKVAFNLTKRQLIFFGIAAAAALPVFFIARPHIGTSNAMLLLVVVALPLFLAAMYEKNGQPLEKILMNFWKWNRKPKIRKYQTQNIYSVLSVGRKGESAVGKKTKASGKPKKAVKTPGSKKAAK